MSDAVLTSIYGEEDWHATIRRSMTRTPNAMEPAT
jgi:hypothetical protein